MTNRLGTEQNIAADAADFRWDMINDNNLPSSTDGMEDEAILIFTRAPLERTFHGVRALRMIPVEGDTLGRSGLLAHGYMLGPNGDSNGCVSIRDYERFLAAFERGEIKRLVVVSNVADLARQPLKS